MCVLCRCLSLRLLLSVLPLGQVDPSGTYFGWKATAIGKNHINAKV